MAEGSKIEDEYKDLRPVYEAFTENAHELLRKLLEDGRGQDQHMVYESV